MSLEYEVLDNGWTVQIHTPIKDITEEEQAEILKLIIQNTMVFWRNQNLNEQEELDFCARFGGIDFTSLDWDKATDDQKSLFIREYPGILRVTAKPGETGRPGHFHHKEELKWHCNRPNDPKRKSFIWLYAVEGSKDSITHWTNSILAYNDLPPELKKHYDTLEVSYHDSRFRIDHDRETYQKHLKKIEHLKTLNFKNKLVLTNPYGQKGLYISPLQVGEITGMDFEEMIEFTNNILEYLTQPKYVYSHHWEDGDVLIGEQFFGLHKRDAFEKMHERYLHRIAFNSTKMFPELKYEGYTGDLWG